MHEQYTGGGGECGRTRVGKSSSRGRGGEIAGGRIRLMILSVLAIMVLFISPVSASKGDRLPEFKECVKVCLLRPRPGHILSVEPQD